MAAIRNEEWDDWFSKQYDLLVQIKRAIDGLSESKPEDEKPVFKAALWSAVIETGAEEMRMHLNLDKWNETKKEVDTNAPS